MNRLVGQLHDGGPIAAITCGWRDREDEDQALRNSLGVDLINLQLRRRKQDIFDKDPELAQAHERRQQILRHKQDFYRIRLEAELRAHSLIRSRSAPPQVQAEEQAASLSALQRLDAYHIDDCAAIHQRFEEETNLAARPEVRRHRDEIRELLGRCTSVAISGGHVATIYNRLTFFGLTEALDNHVVFAWSGGAMAISDRIVLYHDSPPQGSGAAEILSLGTGWVPNIVVLAEPEKRLRRDPERVGILSARFQPARSLAFPTGAHLVWANTGITHVAGIQELHPEGHIDPLVIP